MRPPFLGFLPSVAQLSASGLALAESPNLPGPLPYSRAVPVTDGQSVPSNALALALGDTGFSTAPSPVRSAPWGLAALAAACFVMRRRRWGAFVASASFALLASACSTSDSLAASGEVDASADTGATSCLLQAPGRVCPALCNYCGTEDPQCAWRSLCAGAMEGHCFECQGDQWVPRGYSCDCAWEAAVPDAPTEAAPDAPAEAQPNDPDAPPDSPCGDLPEGSVLSECPSEDCTTCPKPAACDGACAVHGCLSCANGSWQQEAWDCFCLDAGAD